MKFNKNEFGWKEKVSVNTDELVTKNDIPHYNETLMFEISGEDFKPFANNSYFNMDVLNIDETKLYVGELNPDINSDEEYKYKFVYNKESDALIDENSHVFIYNHKSYDGTNFVEDTNSAVITLGITPMDIGFAEEGYFKLYEVDKLELDNNCLSNNVIIANSLTVGERIGDIGIYSVAEGAETMASGVLSHSEGASTTASGSASHAEGAGTTASGGMSHAEGDSSISSNYASHAEGGITTASGLYSHAEGFNTTASGDYSHTEGRFTEASGTGSHTEGDSTKASSDYQHVQGKYNIEDTENKYAHIVGNGTSDGARSNAHTLDWNGNGWYKGKLSQEGTPTEDKDLTTKKYVDENNQLCWLEDYEATGSKLQYADVNVSSLTSRVFYAFNFKKHPGVTTVRLLKSYDDGTIKSIINLGSTLEYMYLMNISSSIMKFYLKYATGIVSQCVCTFGNTSDECTFERTPVVLHAKNTYEYIPTTDYNPATKKYVDDKFIALDLMETVGTIPQSELQKCNNGTSRYVSSIDFDTLFSEPNNYLYYATYKDDTLIPIEYQSNYNRMVTHKLDSADGEMVIIGFDYGTHMMYPFNGGMASIKAYTFTNDLIIKRCPLINANIIATKEYVNERVGNSVITVNNVNNSLTLTTDKNQYVTLVVPVEVILPTVTEYTEIHLFFNGSEGAELNTTNVKWESQLTIENNKSYEVVFTYVNDVIGWLAKSIIYN